MTTNEEFNELRKKHDIGIAEAARMMDASLNTVKCWTASTDSVNYRRLPPYALKLFKLLVEKR